MKWPYILLGLFLLFALVFTLSHGNKTPAHDAFVGTAPTASKPYNIMDYTKPAAQP